MQTSHPSFPRRRESRESTSATTPSPLPGFRVALRLPGMTIILSSVGLAVIRITLPSFPRRRESRALTLAGKQSPRPGFRVALRLPGMTDTFFEVKSDTHRKHTPVIPAEAGIQGINLGDGSEASAWIPGRATLARNDGHLFRGKVRYP